LPLLGSASSPQTYVHGNGPGEIPTIYVGASSVGIELGNMSALQYLKFVSSAPTAAMIILGTVDHVISISSSADGACDVYSNSVSTQVPIADSLCVATAAGAPAIDIDPAGSSAVEIGSDTAISTGPGGIGVLVEADHSSTSNGVEIHGSIVRGAAAGVKTIAASGATVGVGLSYSDYSLPPRSGAGGSITTESSDITAAPKFVDAAKFNYREAPGSPTIDAYGPTSGTDLDSNPRTILGKTDMGAYEYAPSPSGVRIKVIRRTVKALHLLLTFDRNGLGAQVNLVASHRSHRRTSNYENVAAGKSPASVHLLLTNLVPHRNYAIRGVVVGIGGVAKSSVIHATTKESPAHHREPAVRRLRQEVSVACLLPSVL
jgi:hypothetical protein